jgi:predicted ATPase/DNA-binding SARP family transcriptional activator
VTTELTLLSRVAYHGREITGPRLRGLLALLAGELRSGCGTARLVEALWPDKQPENPTKALQILVSRARALVGAEVIASTPTGYRLTLDEHQVDSSAILLSAAASARQSRAGDPAGALEHAEAGLALWGEPTDGEPGDPLTELRAERAGAYRSLQRAKALALARLGRHAEAVEPLAEVAAARPRDEEVLLELLRAEAVTLGPAAALARYENYRRTLRDELGADPGPALTAGYQQLLQGTAATVRHGVPHEPNPLLGRDDDIAAVTNLLRTSRVTSIVGPGGLGKTRLANMVCRQAEQRIVHLVGLAGVGTDEEVAGEVAAAVGVGEMMHPVTARLGAQDALSGIAGALGSGPALLVLDNCEHVLAGVAELVGALVAMTKDLRVLTTSRAPLGLSSESVYPLPELDLATSVELFEQRARAARPGVELPSDTIAELCRRLDGLPLAVELAAARVRVMSVTELAGRLADRFDLLRGGPRDAPQRHRTLHAVVDWSWNLLEPDDQAAMRALSIFPGGFTSGAAAHLLGYDEVLEPLVDQSLLKVVDTPSGTRFRMLETIREFSSADREAAGETERVIDGFLGWVRSFAVAQHDALYGPDPFTRIELIRAEQDNLVLALRYGQAREDAATVAGACALLTSLWTVESSYNRLAAMTSETAWLLSHYRPEPELVEVTRTALALNIMFTFSLMGPRATRAVVALRRLPPAPPNTMGRAVVLMLDALFGDGTAIETLSHSDEPVVAVGANAALSYIHEAAGDLESALKSAQRMLEAVKLQDCPWMEALTHGRISELCLQLDRPAEVRSHLLAGLPVLERMGARADADGIRVWLVLANLRLGALDEAEHWLRMTAQNRSEPDPSTLGYDLAVRAEMLLARGEVDAGLRMWRRVVDRLRNGLAERIPGIPAGEEPWSGEAQTVAVVAHARHGRLEPIEDLIGELTRRVATLLSNPTENPPPYLMEIPIAGAHLLALGMVDIARGEPASGVRLIALAEKFQYLRNFQPTMSAATAKAAAEDADRPAYADAVSSYADLDRDSLRAVALAVLAERATETGRG